MTENHLSPKYIKVEVLTLKVRTEVTIRETIKMGTDLAIDQAVETEDNMDEEVIDPDFSKITEGIIFKKALADIEDKIVEGSIEMIGMMVTIEVGIGQEKGHSQENLAVTGIEAQAIVGRDQYLELVPIETE